MKFLKIVGIVMLVLLILSSSTSLTKVFADNSSSGGGSVTRPSDADTSKPDQNGVVYVEELTNVSPSLIFDDARIAVVALNKVDVTKYSYVVVSFAVQSSNEVEYNFKVNNCSFNLSYEGNANPEYECFVFVCDGDNWYGYHNGDFESSSVTYTSELSLVISIEDFVGAAGDVHFDYIKVEAYDPDCELTLEDIEALYNVQ